MNPVLLTVFKHSMNNSMGTLEEIYAGVMSQKHIYARKVVGKKDSPEYIRIKRSYTTYNGIKCSLGRKPEICATVRDFARLGDLNLAKDMRLSTLNKEEPIIPEVNKVWDAANNTEHRYL